MVVAKIRVTGILAQVLFRKDIPSGIIGAQVAIEYADSLWKNLKKTVVFRGCGSRDILNALSAQPYDKVAALIRKIVDQTAQPEAPEQCNLEECYYCPFPCEVHSKRRGRI